MSDVRDFGAVGDGKVDDTEAILHAIAEGDGYVHFPRGTYRISGTIELKLDGNGPYALDGAGSTARLVMTAPGPAIRITGTHARPAHPEGVDPKVWKWQRMPTIKNLAIEGAHQEADGVQLEGTVQALLEGLHIRQVRNAVHLLRYNRNILITHSHFYHNTGVGVFMDRANLHQINIIGNHISYNRLGGIRIEKSEIRNLQITGNDIEYNNDRTHNIADEPTAEIYVDTTAPGATVNEVTVCSNTIQATPSKGGRNILIRDQAEQKPNRPPGLWTITGNMIGNQETNVHLIGCHGVVLSGNTIYSCEKYNVLIENSDQISLNANVLRRHKPELGMGMRLVDTKNSVITGCTVEDEATRGQGSGISTLELERCERINITGSQFLSGAPYSVDVVESSGISFNGCTMADLRETRLSKAAIRFCGKGTGNMVTGCSLGPAAGKVVQIEKTSQVTMVNNLVSES